jgi:hypothetical protein
MKSMDGLATKDSMDGIRLARILSIDSDEVRIAERWLLRELGSVLILLDQAVFAHANS